MPGGRTATLDDDGQSITLSDGNKNTITLVPTASPSIPARTSPESRGAVKVTSTIDLN
jgi:hypothetical protein